MNFGSFGFLIYFDIMVQMVAKDVHIPVHLCTLQLVYIFGFDLQFYLLFFERDFM